MPESVIKSIERYETNIYNNGIRNIIEIFGKMKKEVADVISTTLNKIEQKFKKVPYNDMASGIISFQKEIQGAMEGGVGAKKYPVPSNVTAEIPETLNDLTKKIDDAEKEKTAKEDYYKKWLGTSQGGKNNLLELIETYNYDSNDSNIRLGNVLKNNNITATLDSNQTDANYLSLKSSLKTDADQNITPALTSTDVKFEFSKNQYEVDDILSGVNQIFEKFKNYKNYCDNIGATLSAYLYGTDDNSQNSFARKIDDFFGPGREHESNKKNLKDNNTAKRRIGDNSGESFKEDELVDYYYKEDSAKPYFDVLKKEDSGYENELQNRKNFIKEFYDNFDSGSGNGGIFSKKKEEIEKIGKQTLENDEINDLIKQPDGISAELQNIQIVDVKIEWKKIFPGEVKGPWSETWETQKVVENVGDMNVSYPLAFDKFNDKFNKSVKWLKTLSDDIKRLSTNIEALKAHKDTLS